jgi:nucleoside-diphosphate-sugar epimerase
MLAGDQPTVFGDGLTSRDFCYVDNVVEANLLACAAAEEACGQVFNIACNARITLNDLVAEINKVAGTDIEPLYAPERPGDVKHSLAAIEKAERLLGYSARTDFATGLGIAVEWYRRQESR